MKYFNQIYRFLDTNGDGTGDKNANGDYSVTEGIFYIKPPVGEVYEIHRIIASIEDTAGMQAQEFGNLGAPLTNGLVLRLSDDTGVLADITDGLPVKTNAQFGQISYDVELKTWGSGNELLLVRFTFEKSGQPIILRGDLGEKIEVVCNDNLSGLLSQYFSVQGLNISSTKDHIAR